MLMGLYGSPLGEVTGDGFIYCCGHLAAHWAFIFRALKGTVSAKKVDVCPGLLLPLLQFFISLAVATL